MTWVWPVTDPVVTSAWDMTRVHPVTHTIQPHWGTDYRAPTGTPIRSIGTGRVIRSMIDPIAGQYIRIDHGDGVWSGYSHLSRRDVTVGQQVTSGQRIGLAGATGSATAAHLHLEISVDGTKVNPQLWLAAQMLTQSPAPSLEADMPLNDADLAAIARTMNGVLVTDIIRGAEFRNVLRDTPWEHQIAGPGAGGGTGSDRADAWLRDARLAPQVTARIAALEDALSAVAQAVSAGTGVDPARIEAAAEVGARRALTGLRIVSET